MKTALKRLLRSTRVAVSALGKRVPIVLGAARQTMMAVRGARYRRVRRANPVDPRVVLFKAYSGRGYACSPKAIYEAMIADDRFDDFEFVWVFREPLARALAGRGFDVRGLEAPIGPEQVIDIDVALGPEAVEDLRRSTIVVWGSNEHERAHARSAYWFCNSVIPWHIWPLESQAYVQGWHGTPLKRLGCDIDLGVANNALYSGRQTHARYTREGRRFTYLITPSAFASEKLASAFALDETQQRAKILEVGYPRNDVLARPRAEEISRIRARLGVPAGKKAVLYAPTWRDNEHDSATGYTMSLALDFDRLRDALGDEYVVLFRTHYLVASSFDFARYSRFVIDASNVGDINDLYLASDLLVTDYSSVLFDYANLKRPIVFYMYDLDKYSSEVRGFYLDVADLPGPIVRTQEELVEAIRATGTPDAALGERYERFSDRFTYLDDGHASQRVIERVIGRNDT